MLGTYESNLNDSYGDGIRRGRKRTTALAHVSE